MFCKQCGKELADGTKFCGYCGALQGDDHSSSPAETLETAKNQGMVEQRNKVKREKTVPGSGEERWQRDHKKPKGGKGGLIVALVIVALLLVVGTGTLLYFTGDGYNIAKDLKLAGECLEEGEYREALSYYKDALRRDTALPEAYLGSADAYLGQSNTEKAREELKKGIKKVRGDEEAQTLLTAKLAEVYLQEANLRADGGEYDAAYSLLQEGTEETGAAILVEGRAEICLKEAESYIESGDTFGAIQVLRLGLEVTENSSWRQELHQKEAEIYRMESDALLVDGDCLAAMRVLVEGVQETGISALAEREVYLREHIVCVREKGADYQTEYDTAGNPVSETGRNSDGYNYEYKCEYDATGRMIAEEYAESKGYQYKIRYGENGRPMSGSVNGWMWGSMIKSGVLEYDSSSDSAKWTITFRDSDYIWCAEYIWVGAGDMALSRRYDNQGYGLFCEYDAAGNRVKETYSDSADNVNIHEYSYDDAGNQVWDKYYDNVGYGYEKTMVYDASGNILEYTLTDSDGGTEYRSYENEYDIMGQLVLCTEHDRDGNVTSSEEWQYDYLYIGE